MADVGRISSARDDGLALLAGLILPLGFSPFDLAPVAVISVAGLALLWGGTTARRGAWRGWLFGLGAFGAGTSWIHESFQFSQVSPAVSLLLTSGFVALMALYPAGLGYFMRRVALSSAGLGQLLALPSGWALMEWLRGTLFSGFTWLQLGYSQVGWPLDGLFPVLGVLGVGWVVAFTAGGLAALVRVRDRTRWVGITVAAALWMTGGLMATVTWGEPSGEPLRVALLQGNIPQDKKWDPAWRQPTLERYLELTRRHWQADLVVWPETALPGTLHTMSDFVRELAVEAGRHGASVFLGAPVVDAQSRRVFNSLIALGEAPGFYHKRHLVPFGEYLPLRSWIAPIAAALAIPAPAFSRGDRAPPLLRVRGLPVGVSICYEIAFGAEIREALPDAAFLVTVSNDAWFGASIGPHQHLQIARARALETARYLVRATNTGLTAIVDPRGNVIARAPAFEVAELAGTIRPMAGATPYVRFGDGPVVVGALIALIALLTLTRRRRDRRD